MKFRTDVLTQYLSKYILTDRDAYNPVYALF